MTSWDPQQYLRYADPRMRPALDLLNQIELRDPQNIVDAGCGPGNVTEYLVGRWPAAHYVGVDTSAEMLAVAGERHPDLEWVQADLLDWRPDRPVDVFYSNATLHWLDGHAELFPRLMASVSDGGVLAIQMPHNHHAPTHTLIHDIAGDGPWADRLEVVLRPAPVHDAARYHSILSPHATHIDIWETEYLHVLHGEDPVVEWTRGSVLRPVLAALDEAERDQFLDRYTARIAEAYPRLRDGATLLPFRRLFIVARR